MKIKAVRMREVGMFKDPVALEGFSGGLDVLATANETGKSTIFRALRTVFLEKHSATGKVVKALKPRDGGAPLIEADFEHDGQTWRITKQFGRSTDAQLRNLTKDGQVLRKADAEDRLTSLLGLENDGPAGRFNLLWVPQKHGLARPGLDIDPIQNKDAQKRGERPVIMRAIESEVSAIAGGPLARGVRQRVAQALDEQVTTRGAKKGGPLDLARTNHEALKRQLDEATARAEETRLWRDELATLREREQALNTPGRREALAATASDLRAKLANLANTRQQAQTAIAQRETARQKLSMARAQLLAFDTDLEDLNRHDDFAQADAFESKTLAVALTAATKALDDAKTTDAKLFGEQKQLAQILDLRTKRDRARQAGEALHKRTQTLNDAKSLATTIAKERDTLRDNPLTHDLMEQLLAADAELRLGNAQLTAASPAVSIALAKSGSGKISVDGTKLTSDTDYVVANPMSIEIDGIGTIDVAPGQAFDAKAKQADIKRQSKALEQLFRQAGVADIDAARAKLGERETSEQALREAQVRLETLAPEGINQLQDDVTRRSAQISEPLDAATDVPGTDEDLDAKSAKLHHQREQISQTLAQCRDDREAAWSQLETHKAKATAREQHRTGLSEKLGGLDVRTMKRSQLSQTADIANEAAFATERTVEALPTPPDANALDALNTQADNAEADLKTHDSETADIRVQISKREGRIQVADDAGAGVRVLQIEGELQRAATETERIEHDVEALKLLRQTLDEASQSASNQISGPVMTRLTPYLSQLFPDATMTFSEGLRLEGLARGDALEDLETLSDGTLEQLSIVVRLAYARLLHDTGTALPLFLDDPLAYSDDARLDRVFNALKVGAHSHQVIVLTCHQRAFAPLGGNQLQVSAWTDAP